ncbi:hypothetical protein RND81_07G011000 [Saponaria officinalis]|uniref:histidine kinase n=1 Tax=Saponaria officinalis TaxID=3572 RepID=A0AAW1JKT5_SAPOF
MQIVVALMMPSMVIPYLYNTMINKIEQNVEVACYEAITKIQDSSKLVPFLNSSTDFTMIQTKAYALAFPCKELVYNVKKQIKEALIVLLLVLVAVLAVIFSLVTLIVRAATREARLSSACMSQMGKTAHDIRGYIACIKGWIDLSYTNVASTSDLASNLKKMDACANDLLALVNSILDFSKIEAGKMQLDDKEFDIAQLVEDIVDLHYPNAMKKGVDVIFDPCDGSIMNFSKVIGDEGKLKQILTNLLSNAVKFTSQGHISIRVKAKKSTFDSSTTAPNRSISLLSKFLGFFCKSKGANDNEETILIKQRSQCMEFVFEVEDTGPGIPKDKRHSIFDNFVQVKENSVGNVGTGLGLGIALSLVRLMEGDIEIVDKANGEVGTCFKFNIFLTLQGNSPVDHKPRCIKAAEGSLVIVLIKNDERRRMIRRFMKSLGIDLVTLRQGSQLRGALQRIIRRVNMTGSSSLKCILLIIDANAGDFDMEISRSIAHFRKEVSQACIKVVWLDRPDTPRAHFHGLQEESLPHADHVILEPFHGSRLSRVISLLPQFEDLPQIGHATSQQQGMVERKPSAEESDSKDQRSANKKPLLDEASSEKALQGKRFLIVEDNPMLCKLAVSSVTRWGAAHTQVCGNGKQAFEVVCKALSEGSSTLPFDYILMDCQMPVMDGMEATRRIREEERKYDVRIPIIALTAHEAEEEANIVEVGMDCHLTKPLKIEGLLQAIKGLR